jgi:hypothetical protein
MVMDLNITNIAGIAMVGIFLYMIYQKFSAKQKRKDVIEMAKAQKEAERILKEK